MIAVVGEIGKLSLSLRSLESDQVEAANEEGAALSYTFDSDATQLIRPPALHSSTQKVYVVRGSDVKEQDFIRGSGGQKNTASHEAKAE